MVLETHQSVGRLQPSALQRRLVLRPLLCQCTRSRCRCSARALRQLLLLHALGTSTDDLLADALEEGAVELAEALGGADEGLLARLRARDADHVLRQQRRVRRRQAERRAQLRRDRVDQRRRSGHRACVRT